MASLLVGRTLRRAKFPHLAASGATRKFSREPTSPAYAGLRRMQDEQKGKIPTDFPTLEDRDDAEDLLPKLTKPGFLRSSFIKHSVAEDAGSRDLMAHYEIERLLSESGYNQVWLGKRKSTSDYVIIKEVTKPPVAIHESLRLEFETLKVADHPNVVRMHEVFEDNNSYCIIMEYCSGGDLMTRVSQAFGSEGSRISGTSIGMGEIKDIMRQILRAVSYIHQHNIVHRDIKPHHFAFVNSAPDAPIKLIDFGLTGMALVVDGWEKSLLTRRVGTEGFMAPEVMKGNPYGPKADIWSVGATMHVLITGHKPQWNPEYEDYHYPAMDRWTDLSLSGESFIRSMLDPDPDARPNASDLLASSFIQEVSYYEGKNMEAKFAFDPATVQRLKDYGKRTRFERMARVSIAAFAGLYSEESNELSKIFVDADKDHNGDMGVSELATILKRSDTTLDSDAIDMLVGKINTAKNDNISYTEFMAAASSEVLFGNAAGCRRAFSSLDTNGDGLISIEEIDQAMPGVFYRFELLELMSNVDQDGNNQMDYNEFEQLLQGGKDENE